MIDHCLIDSNIKLSFILITIKIISKIENNKLDILKF